ncbi:hypothetical protein RND81_11G010700 [Saponaria officinalis]|uniref:Small ribosomal subunit protein mS38 n=1 Tax=Saponaria officinalis TaxID=3572 RepID=A0AAW1HGN3_SAPOF
MSRLLKELFIRKPNSSRFLSSLTHQNPSFDIKITPKLYANYQSIINPSKNNCFRVKDEEKGDELGMTQLRNLQIYPSFSFGYFLNPVLPSGSGQFQVGMPVGDETEHSGMMWADSVKKKRKKKMNKHKYKKLRKRLRRKTKT